MLAYIFFFTRITCSPACVTQAVRAVETNALHCSTLHITTRITRFTACITQVVRAAETNALHCSALHITTRITCFTACVTQAVRAAETNALHCSALHITTRITRFTVSLYCVHCAGRAGGGDECTALVRAALRVLLREQRPRSRTPRPSRWCMCGVCCA